MEDKNIEDRIKALEEKLNPSPDKMSTMKVTNAFKAEIDNLRYFTENDKSYEFVLWRLLGDREAYLQATEQLGKELTELQMKAEKVPALEKEIKTLHETIVGNLLDENNYLKEIAELKDSMKVDKETQEDVVWRLKKQAEKVPALEKRAQELEERIKELENIITDYEFHESCESALRDESDIGDEK